MEIKDVEHLAELAKIELNQAEKEQILKDMEGILAYVKQIEEVEVPDIGVEYLHKNQWREDVLSEKDSDTRDSILVQFPDSHDNFVKVKKIL
ncbi:MAG: Asp-tRNA(Asn)/Glu-tRNA(Gln) amidotransferase subunit GatC [Candidatus Paceibacterota bacterium]